MDGSMFDALTRLVGAASTRRQALKSALASTAAGLGAASLLGAEEVRAKKKKKKKKCEIPQEGCLLCVLSGEPDEEQAAEVQRMNVDDGLTVFLNGQVLFEDDGGGSVGPVAFAARRGDSLRIVAVDAEPDCHALRPLFLQCGCSEPRKLSDGMPETCHQFVAIGQFFDETFTI